MKLLLILSQNNYVAFGYAPGYKNVFWVAKFQIFFPLEIRVTTFYHYYYGL